MKQGGINLTPWYSQGAWIFFLPGLGLMQGL